MRLQRHDMVLLEKQTASCIAKALLMHHHIDEKEAKLSTWYPLLVNGFIPAIIRRSDNELKIQQGDIPIGISLPFRIEGQRVRFANWIKEQHILRVISPFDIPTLLPKTLSSSLNNSLSNSLKTLQILFDKWQMAKCSLGVWGANALEILTGLSYTDDVSDLDIITCINHRDGLSDVYQLVRSLEQECSCRIDVELKLNSGYGISLKEFFRQGSTVLGKGLTGVRLLNKADIMLD